MELLRKHVNYINRVGLLFASDLMIYFLIMLSMVFFPCSKSKSKISNLIMKNENLQAI